jgi:diadenosine tetraphosphatase ApaH/serine/threonine PP2A family protein phosphatase
MEKKQRTIFVGDIHGCLEEFNELLVKLNYNPKNDRLILLGDLVDRGPDSAGVVSKAREMNLECLMGNHEHKYVKWFRSQGTKVDVYDRDDYYDELSEQDTHYINTMPTYIELGDVVAVHAGLKPGIALSDQKKDDLMYLRYTDADRRFISLKKISKLGKEQAGAKFWTEFWTGPKSVVYGHNVHSYIDPLIEEVSPGVMCYGLDTGCCFGGRLTALIWETKEIVQVQAKSTHYKSDFDVQTLL